MNLEYWRDQKYVKVFLSIFNILFDAEEGWRENIIFFFCDFSLWTPEGAKYSEFLRCWFLQAMKGRKFGNLANTQTLLKTGDSCLRE